MKTEAQLMKVGIGIHIPKPSTERSEQRFIDWLFKFDFNYFGVSLSSVEGTNICWVIGIMFDIEDSKIFSIRELQNFIQKQANIKLR